MQYTIFDRDVFCNSGEFVLSGAHYCTLISKCIQYSSCFSLYPCRLGDVMDKELAKWRVAPPIARANEGLRLLFYKSCSETYALLNKITNSLFGWEDNTNKYSNDLTFYREDGTVFMETLVHEGECSIYPREDENVDDLLSFGNWIFVNAQGELDAPAVQHQLPPPLQCEVIEDPLYALLQEIRRDPENYLSAVTVEDLEQRICAYRPPWVSADAPRITPKISALPHWYLAFQAYVQGENDCSTATPVARAICRDGIDGPRGFSRFYELLDEYLETVCLSR